MPLGSSSDAPVMRPGPSRASSPAFRSMLARGFPDAVRFHSVVVVVEGFVLGSSFELVAFRFRVHTVGVEVIGGGASLSGGFVMGRPSPVCHCPPLARIAVHGQY